MTKFVVGDEVTFVKRGQGWDGLLATIAGVTPGGHYEGGDAFTVLCKKCPDIWKHYNGKPIPGWGERQLELVYSQPDETEAFFV